LNTLEIKAFLSTTSIVFVRVVESRVLIVVFGVFSCCSFSCEKSIDTRRPIVDIRENPAKTQKTPLSENKFGKSNTPHVSPNMEAMSSTIRPLGRRLYSPQNEARKGIETIKASPVALYTC